MPKRSFAPPGADRASEAAQPHPPAPETPAADAPVPEAPAADERPADVPPAEVPVVEPPAARVPIAESPAEQTGPIVPSPGPRRVEPEPHLPPAAPPPEWP